MQDETGGYCPKCDTVWATPGKCNCDPLLKKHGSAIDAMSKAVWNAAIEAAANLVQDEMGDPDDTFWIVEKVRKLKK